MHSIALACITLTLNLIYATHGFALSEIVPVDEPLKEVIDPRPDVSGSPLVGFRLGKPEGKVNVKKIYIVVPPTPPAICIEARTQDGRYSAENLYSGNTDLQADIAKVNPFSKDKEIVNTVEEYPVSQVAIRAYQNADGLCLAKNALFLPQSYRPRITPQPLSILINAGSRLVTATLHYTDEKSKSGKTKTGQCDPAGGEAQLTFNTICTFEPIALKQAQKTRVTINLDDGFEAEPVSVDILLPATQP